MIEAYKKFFRNYVNFEGRSTRADYWWVVLCNVIIGFAFGLIGNIFGTKVGTYFSYVYELATLIPGLAIVVRRLHDINKSGWYFLMILIPLAGPIIVLVYLLTDSVKEGNKYGKVAE